MSEVRLVVHGWRELLVYCSTSCVNWDTVGPASHLADIYHCPSRAHRSCALYTQLANLLLISCPAKDRRLSWPEHAAHRQKEQRLLAVNWVHRTQVQYLTDMTTIRLLSDITTDSLRLQLHPTAIFLRPVAWATGKTSAGHLSHKMLLQAFLKGSLLGDLWGIWPHLEWLRKSGPVKHTQICYKLASLWV